MSRRGFAFSSDDFGVIMSSNVGSGPVFGSV